ncbi:WecB/TagA/CpsF family glycosyltransferase [Mycolicibacterium elephantis]|uniref:WecB/TagA/CpsF family glycosyltransferase n=1 Tax=Mycolicibacterium elephantis TaxID=81858 RepID=UPI001F26C223|nr:WecB/TagA/CpsF family glycosyltransferase [Mycolicibacterium elephantis]
MVNASAESCRVGPVDFAITTLEQAVKRTLDDALRERNDHVHLANAWSIALANEDHELRGVFQAGRNYPDGQPVVWAMRWLRGGQNGSRPGRVYGPTFFEKALEEGAELGVRHYFLGSTPETLSKLKSNIHERFPSAEIVGVSSPPFKDLSPEDLEYELSKIESCKPHIVWVGLGTPKQDFVAAYLAEKYAGVFACVGAAFDFTAGNLRAVPLWVQVCGMAWFYRFIQEPRRLWRRYTYGNAKFLGIVFEQLSGKRFALLRGHKSS